MAELFTPTKLGEIDLANRLVMAPMTRNRARADGTPTSQMRTYYAQRAEAGLIITEGTHPIQNGQGFANTPGLRSDVQAAQWHTITDAVHERGGRIVLQLMHAGRIGHPTLYPSAHRSVAPSPVTPAGSCYTSAGPRRYLEPLPLSRHDIQDIVRAFARAARRAMSVGFDGVEIHGGNGLLLHQFLAVNTNLRSDEYGGSAARRAQFGVQVVHAVADAIGPGRVGLRIGPGNPYNDIVEDDVATSYRPLLEQLPRLAFLHHVDTGANAETIRQLWPGAIVLNPRRGQTIPAGTWDPTATDHLVGGSADAIAVGAAFLSNPDLPARIRQGGPYNAADPSTYYTGGSAGYTDYPTLQEAS